MKTESPSDDELLSALLDNELPEAQSRALRDRLAHEPALAARLDALRDANAMVASKLAGIADEPLPAHITALLAETETGTGTETGASDSKVIPLRRRFATQFFSMPAAMAAGVALAFGFVLAHLLAPQLRAPESAAVAVAVGPIGTDSPLHQVLERSPSGVTNELARDQRAIPTLSFRAVDDAFCRQFSLGGRDGTTSALACRRQGVWQVELASFRDTAMPDAGESVFRPASETAAVMIDIAIDDLIDGDVFDPEYERQLIDGGWILPDR